MYQDYRQSEQGLPGSQTPRYEPDDQEAIALLQFLSKEQLEGFLHDQEKIQTHINDLDQVPV